MKRLLQTAGCVLAAGVMLLGWTGSASAGVHTWDVVEVFSDATGNIQYVELQDVGLAPGGEVNIGNATIASTTQSHAIGNGPVTAPTAGKSYLIATPGFAALSGAPTPDEILPAGVVPFFATSGDTITVGIDSHTFGTVPTDGVNALTRAGATVTNTPTNYAGTSGTVNAAAPPPSVPLTSWPAVMGMLALIVGTGTGAVAWAPSRRR